jgi:hypothetical protein
MNSTNINQKKYQIILIFLIFFLTYIFLFLKLIYALFLLPIFSLQVKIFYFYINYYE